jgi:glycosyltransferase involved in cell wall biosynthesis
MSKPLISFIVCAYNQERFIREAVEGAFAQTYTPLEIILSDDCSPDRTFEIMREMAAAYRGPHRLVLNRNKKNLGIGGHVNRIIELSNGEILVPAAGDDISFKERTERIFQFWMESNRSAFSIYSNIMEIDSSGAHGDLWNPGVPPTHATTLQVAVERGVFWLWGCSHAFHRKVFDVFGPMEPGVIYEDDVIPFRSLLLGTIKYIPEPLIYYRRHEDNTSGPKLGNVVPPMKRRCRTLYGDRAKFLTWLQDLRKATVLGLIPREESERLQDAVIELLHERSIEHQFYRLPFPAGLFWLLRRYLGWNRFLQEVLRPLKRRLQSQMVSIDDRPKPDNPIVQDSADKPSQREEVAKV